MIRLIFALILLYPASALAGEEYGDVNFLNGWRQSDGSYQTAVDFDLAEGWKTYWRSPGPAGIPPAFNWEGSSNIKDVRIDWPTPHVFESYGLYSIGYEGHVALPIHVTPIDPAKPININLRMEFGVCSDICVPADARFTLTLGDLPDVGISTIKAALNDGPLTAQKGGVRKATCALKPNGTGFDIETKLYFDAALNGKRTTVIEYADPDIWVDVANTHISGKNLTANTTIEYYGDGMLSIDRSAIRITVLDDNQSVEVLGCPAA